MKTSLAVSPLSFSISGTPPTDSFAQRITVLIQRVGSATQIARMCGFSEGVVRSWRDGATDPSRARCVTLAKTLGISLVWLVAGEGMMQADLTPAAVDEQHSSVQHMGHRVDRATPKAAHERNFDEQRLSIAMSLLHSELELSGNKLSLPKNADMLAELYEIIGPEGGHADASAIVAFNHRLNERLRHDRGIT